MKREVKITVAGQVLTLRTDESERYLKQLADHVDAHMKELTHGQRGTTTLNIAILAALNVADEYFKLRVAAEQANASIDALAGRLESSMAKAAG